MYTVLIVEDEVLISIGMRNRIPWSDMDMTVIGDARNGREGLEIYRREKPDIILTDIKMPVMDGLEMIEEIRKQDNDTKIIVLSCHEDYELVRRAFIFGVSDYILKLEMMPDDMVKVIHKVHQELTRSRTVEQKRTEEGKELMNRQKMADISRDFMLYNGASPEAFKQVIGALALDKGDLTVCVMDSGTGPKKQDAQRRREQQIIVELVQNVLDEYSAGIVFAEHENRYLMLLHVPDGEKEEKRLIRTENLLKRIGTVMENYIDAEARFGVARFGDFWEHLGQLYEEALNSLHWSVILGKNITYYSKVIARQQFRTMLNDFIRWTAGEKSLADGCREEILKEIRLLMEFEEPDLGHLRESFRHLIYHVSVEVKNRDRVLKLVFEATEQIRTANSLKELIGAFEKFVRQLPEDEEYLLVNPEVKQAIIYIREHYHEKDISLQQVSDVVGMNKEYFSSLFKKNTGMGFSEYVNKVRVNKACELLKTTTMRSYEVALSVGIPDESYFSRIFKKIVGMRPNEYRKHEIVSGEVVS